MRLKTTLLFLLTALFTQLVFPQQEDLITVGKISVSGDKITHKPIIFRELEFKEGETLSEIQLDNKIELSRQNLLNQSLFNFVFIDKKKIGNIIDIEIRVIERWYIWPIPLLEYADRNINVWWQTKDFSRINFGVDLRIENFRGRKEQLNIIAKGGYDQLFKVNWQIPYLNKNKTFGMGFNAQYKLNHEIAVSTEKNKYVFYRSDDNYARKVGNLGIGFIYRPYFRFLHQVNVNFNHLQIDDSVLMVNPDFTYGETEYNYFSINYTYKQDFRDYKPYPLNGYYFDIQLTKIGFGIISEDVSQIMLDFTADHYFNIYKRLNFAYSFRGRLSYTNNYQPFFLSEGIGVNGFDLRGYELYIINGQNIGVFKSNFKFTLVPMKDFQIKWIKSEKFSKVFYGMYANIFFDMGYAKENYFSKGNPLSNQLLWGTGVGLDFITYYDIVIGLSYAINKQNDKGFFVSLVAPI
ncbi:MAG: hypothetical protein C0598_04370 [Marinilabiliales bacterium]|nr:MAG: hypothetical protein C0598_04370 [Marinilabiliales bacterium]